MMIYSKFKRWCGSIIRYLRYSYRQRLDYRQNKRLERILFLKLKNTNRKQMAEFLLDEPAPFETAVLYRDLPRSVRTIIDAFYDRHPLQMSKDDYAQSLLDHKIIKLEKYNAN